MQVVFSHPTGNQNVRAVLDALSDGKMLGEFNTTLAIRPDSNIMNLIPGKLRQELLRRSYPVAANEIWTHPYLELARLVLPKIGLNTWVKGENSWAGIDSVYKNFDKAVAKHLKIKSKKSTVHAVYAYEDGALETFRQAKALGIKCIYDLPIAYWETGRALLKKEAERLPQWAPTLGGGINDSETKLERKTKELELADMVVGPGTFVMDSLPVWAKNKQLVMSPFGSPVTKAGDKEITPDNTRPLRVLFVGSMGQRKGLGDLFDAMKLLNRQDVELVVMGSLLSPMAFYKNEFHDFKHESGRPHAQVLELMRSCDVFCLPSIVEGRALVMQEAMSQGLPLIITANTGGADLILEGKTGFLVPISSPHQIADKINWFAENRSAMPAMGNLGMEHARNYTWKDYGEKIVRSISEFLQPV